jgi:hypothetical protein
MVYSPSLPPTGAVVSESPFVRSLDVIAMMANWKVMAAVTNGTSYIQDRADEYLPQEPREDDDAWQARISRSVLSPYTSRLIETATGAILRKPIQIEGDDYWLEFAKDVDGIGSSINEYARRALVSALTYGHSAILVDYPAATGAMTLAEERAMGRRPYFVHVDAPQIWGWRKESGTNRLTQVRIHDYELRPLNEFGEEQVEVMRVIYPGRYEEYTLGQDVVSFEQSGGYSLNEIPLVPIYTNRRGVLQSLPPLLDIANLNIAHYQRQSDLIHALHIAAMPTLVLEGWSQDSSDATIGVNYALGMEPGHKAYYVQSDATSFEAQMKEIENMEGQMSTLGVTKLFGQKYVAESAESKRIDQTQSNSVLSIVGLEMESALTQAFEFAAEYVGIEPPKIRIETDFSFYRLIGQDIAALLQLNERNKLSDTTLIQILQKGEIIPDDIKPEDELAAAQENNNTQPAGALPGLLDNTVRSGTQPMNNSDDSNDDEDSDPNDDPDEPELTNDRVDRLIELLSR